MSSAEASRVGDAAHGVRAVAAAERHEGVAERGAFAGAVNLRVRGEDAFAERCAGTRHADDEDRRRIAVFCARAGRETGAVEVGDIRLDRRQVVGARERLHRREQLVRRRPMRERAGVLAAAGAKLCEIVARHHAVLGHHGLTGGVERRLHRGGGDLGGHDIAFASREQDLAPVPERGERLRQRAQRGTRCQRMARVSRAAELEQGQRALQVPVARRVGIAGRRPVEQRQRVGAALLLQQVGGEVQPGGGVARIGRDRLAQQRLGRVRLAGQPQEGAEIGPRRPCGPGRAAAPGAWPSWPRRSRRGDSGRPRSSPRHRPNAARVATRRRRPPRRERARPARSRPRRRRSAAPVDQARRGRRRSPRAARLGHRRRRDSRRRSRGGAQPQRADASAPWTRLPRSRSHSPLLAHLHSLASTIEQVPGIAGLHLRAPRRKRDGRDANRIKTAVRRWRGSSPSCDPRPPS